MSSTCHAIRTSMQQELGMLQASGRPHTCVSGAASSGHRMYTFRSFLPYVLNVVPIEKSCLKSANERSTHSMSDVSPTSDIRMQISLGIVLLDERFAFCAYELSVAVQPQMLTVLSSVCR
jgi:hypothetical protein